MESILRRLKTTVDSIRCCKGFKTDAVSKITGRSISEFVDSSEDRSSPRPVWRCQSVSPRTPMTPFPPIPGCVTSYRESEVPAHCTKRSYMEPMVHCKSTFLDPSPHSSYSNIFEPVAQFSNHNYLDSFPQYSRTSYLEPLEEVSDTSSVSSDSSSSSGGSLFSYRTPFDPSRGQNGMEIFNSPVFTDVPDTARVDLFLNFRNLSYLEKRKRRPLTHVVGAENQLTVNGVYAGAQCTVTALNAIVYHYYRNMAFWTKSTIDNIVRNGDFHHTLFREYYQYSRNPDGRIALDELPSLVRLNYAEPNKSFSVNAHIGESSGLVFLGQTGMTEGLKRPTLKCFLKNKTKDLDHAMFLLTIQDKSYSAVKNERGQWFLFDSHGSLRVAKPMIGRAEKRPVKDCLTGATVSRFSSLRLMMKTLKKNHGSGAPSEARLVTVIPKLDLDFVEEDEKKSKSRVAQEFQAPRYYLVTPKANVYHKPAPTYTVRARSRCDSRAQFIVAPPISDGSAGDVSDEDIILLL